MPLNYVSIPGHKMQYGNKYVIQYHMGNFTPYVTYTGIFIRHTQKPRNFIFSHHDNV